MNEIMVLVSVLEEFADKVRNLEEKALATLDAPRDEKRYRQLLEEKTVLLSRLPELLAGHLRLVPEALAEECLATLTEMAEDAMQAKAIGSQFYMSVLLYSSEQQQGDPNDLQQFILWLRQKV